MQSFAVICRREDCLLSFVGDEEVRMVDNKELESGLKAMAKDFHLPGGGHKKLSRLVAAYALVRRRRAPRHGLARHDQGFDGRWGERKRRKAVERRHAIFDGLAQARGNGGRDEPCRPTSTAGAARAHPRKPTGSLAKGKCEARRPAQGRCRQGGLTPGVCVAATKGAGAWEVGSDAERFPFDP
jgi:hypothetical protein